MFIQRRQPALLGRISLAVGLVCGWSFSEHGPRSFLDNKGLGGEVGEISYRGDGKVGSLRFRDRGGTVRSFSRREFHSFAEKLDYRSSFSRIMHRARCRICRDHINLCADVAVGDAWLKRRREEKVSLVVSRTARGEGFLRRASESGHIRLIEGREEDIIESQSRDLVYGHTARNRAGYLEGKGSPVTRFVFSGEEGHNPPVASPTPVKWGVESFLAGAARRGFYRTYRLLFALLEPGMLWSELRGRLAGLRRRK